jgi:hypothetical protein
MGLQENFRRVSYTAAFLMLSSLLLILSGCRAVVAELAEVEDRPQSTVVAAVQLPSSQQAGEPTQTAGLQPASAADDTDPAPADPTATAINGEAEAAPEETEAIGQQPQAQEAALTAPRDEPRNWAKWPLLPAATQGAKEIFLRGQALGNNPRVFSTIGDCQSEPAVFMGIYDTKRYYLGEGYEHLEETIQHFQGSFKRENVTVRDGLSVASVLSPNWADPELCQDGETPLACEIRLHRPAIMFVNLGTNWRGGDDVKHEAYMRKVIDILLAEGVVPILSSKGDNQEGDHRINRSIARVAYDYDLPFWNFWVSIRGLPDKGIDTTREGGYLTVEAWARRSFTGLQALDAVWRELALLIQ